jgi:Zn-dependent protease
MTGLSSSSFPAPPPLPVVCPQCRTEIAATLLSCPSCGRLVHGGRLNELASGARAAEQVGDLPTAMSLWREALELLPKQSQQYQTISEKLASLGKQLDSAPPSAKSQAADGKSAFATGAAGAGAIALLLWKFKFLGVFILTKGKLLLLGLTKSSTFFSMFLSLGVYWAAWGWKFALGLVLSIYVHEMGHVAALRRLGFKATAPMFIPGLGALIRLKQHTTNPHEDARIGLAGPIWGLGAAIAAAGVWLATGLPIWAATAKVGAWINLFNLLPIWQLDGGRGWRALSRQQSWLVVATLAAMWFWTHDGLLVLILIVGIMRAVAKEKTDEGDTIATVHWVVLLALLSALTMIPVPKDVIP